MNTVIIMKQSDIVKCPFYIMDPIHYRADGSCKCDDIFHRNSLMKTWGYTKKDFKNIPLR